MPIFKDCMTYFEVSFSVSDKLDAISLHVTALEPSKSMLSGTSHLSFVPKDADFLCKALKKPIEVHIEKKGTDTK